MQIDIMEIMESFWSVLQNNVFFLPKFEHCLNVEMLQRKFLNLKENHSNYTN